MKLRLSFNQRFIISLALASIGLPLLMLGDKQLNPMLQMRYYSFGGLFCSLAIAMQLPPTNIKNAVKNLYNAFVRDDRLIYGYFCESVMNFTDGNLLLCEKSNWFHRWFGEHQRFTYGPNNMHRYTWARDMGPIYLDNIKLKK